MYTRTKKWYVLIPVIYVVIIVGLLFLQFSGTLVIRRSLSTLSMQGTLVPGLDETSKEITSANIQFEGIQFVFSKEKSLLLRSSSTFYPISILSYDMKASSISLHFEQDITLEFVEESEDSLQVHLHLPDLPSEITTISIPYFFLPGVSTEEETKSSEIISIRYSENDYIFMLPPGTITNAQDSRLSIPVGYGKSVIRYARASGEFTRADPLTILSELSLPSLEEYQSYLDEFIENSYQGWKETRYNGGSGTWNMYGTPARFKESILIAYLAEAWVRNDEYIVAYNRMQRAASLHPELISITSSPYLGSLRDIIPRSLAEAVQNSATLLERIQARDVTIFEDTRLLSFVSYRADDSVRQELVSFLPFLDYRSVSMPVAIGMLAGYVQRSIAPSNIASWLERFRPIVEEIIFPKLIRIRDGVFVETSQNEVNVLLSTLAGILIEKIGLAENDDLLIDLGREIVLSSITLADGNGFMPYAIFIGSVSAEQSDYRFGPEDIYHHIVDNPRYPSYINVTEYFGRHAWMFTISDIADIESGNQTFSVVFRSVPERTHYITIQGIPEFSSMNLFGLTWRDDPGFEAYVRGRHYADSTNTLMIKYNDILSQRRMTVFFEEN